MTTNIDIVVEDFNSPFTSMDRSFKQIYIIYTHILHIYITKEALNLKCFRQDGLGFYIYRTFHPKTEEYTFFSNSNGTFSRIDQMLGYKTSFSAVKKTETIIKHFLTRRLLD